MTERSVTIERAANGYVVIASEPWGSYGRRRLVAETTERAVELAVLDLDDYPVGTRVEVRIVRPERET